MMSLSRGLREPCSSSILQARGGASRRLDDARSELIGTLLRDGKIVSRPKAKEQRRSRWTRRGWAGGARTLFVPKVQGASHTCVNWAVNYLGFLLTRHRGSEQPIT